MSKLGRLGRLAVAATVIAAVSIGAAPRADAARVYPVNIGAAPNAAIDVTSDRFNPGSELRLHGTNWGANEVVELRLAPTYGSARANAAGEWWKTIKVPEVAVGTSIPLQGVGTLSKTITNTPFEVQPFAPFLQMNTYRAPVGTELDFTTYRFKNGEDIKVTRAGKTIATGKADKRGNFRNVGSYVIPAEDVGKTITFTATGQASGVVATRKEFVTPLPSVPEPAPLEPVTLGTQDFSQMLPGQTLWQPVNWIGSTTNNACDFRVTVDNGQGFGVEYPAPNFTYTSLPGSSTLNEVQGTYTAIRLTAPANLTADTALNLTATYQPCGDDVPAGTAPVTLNKTVTIPVAPPGAPFIQNTPEVGPYSLSTEGTQVAEINFSSFSTELAGFRLQITDSSGLQVYYPEYGTSTQPYKKDDIDLLDNDYVGFRLGFEGVTPGVYILKTRVTYGSANLTKDSTLAVTVN